MIGDSMIYLVLYPITRPYLGRVPKLHVGRVVGDHVEPMCVGPLFWRWIDDDRHVFEKRPTLDGMIECRHYTCQKFLKKLIAA